MKKITAALFLTLALTATTEATAANFKSKAVKAEITKTEIPAVTPSGVPEAALSINEAALNPENLGAQTFLEDLLVRRYSQELATFVDRGAFTLGAQLDLAELPPDADGIEQDTPSDLLLGTLDTDELLKKYGGSEGTSAFQGFLSNHKIKSVAISVGLKDDLNPTVKAEVEKWLTTRLGSEFGKAGKGSVTEIKMPKGLWAWINRFQSLAGQLVLAFAILFGAILWKLMSTKSEGKEETTAQGQTQAVAPLRGPVDEDGKPKENPKKTIETDAGVSTILGKEIDQLSRQLIALVPKLSVECENVLRTWCKAGDEGRLKVACFVEAVGMEMGKLPIPVDALADLSKVFARMPNLSVNDKRDTLRKVYWDMLMSINLGPDSLEQPFDYLGSMNIGLVNQVLIDQNPKMKALVALHMSSSARESYLKTQDNATKLELLQTTSEMSEIAMDELKSIDGMFKSKLQPQTGKGVVMLDASLNKLISGLSPIEEATLLTPLKGAAIDAYKRSTPSIAFLDSWPDDKLGICLSRAMSDTSESVLS